jgi:hypothetical protein
MGKEGVTIRKMARNSDLGKWRELLERFIKLDKGGAFYDDKLSILHDYTTREIPYIQRYVIGNLLSFAAMLHWIGGYGHDSITTRVYARMAMVVWLNGLTPEESHRGYLRVVDKKSKEYQFLMTLPSYLREQDAGNGIANGFRYKDALKTIEYLESDESDWFWKKKQLAEVTMEE